MHANLGIALEPFANLIGIGGNRLEDVDPAIESRIDIARPLALISADVEHDSIARQVVIEPQRLVALKRLPFCDSLLPPVHVTKSPQALKAAANPLQHLPKKQHASQWRELAAGARHTRAARQRIGLRLDDDH